jgi:phosphohistidine phosphatase SixA
MSNAEALSKSDSDVEFDAERTLSEKGVAQASLAGELLVGMSCIPGRIVSSPLIRSQMTGNLINDELEFDIKPIPLTLLLPGSSTDELLRAMVNYGASDSGWFLAIMHEPDISLILSNLLYDGDDCPFNVHEGDVFGLNVAVTQGAVKAKLIFSLSPDRLLDDDMSA